MCRIPNIGKIYIRKIVRENGGELECVWVLVQWGHKPTHRHSRKGRENVVPRDGASTVQCTHRSTAPQLVIYGRGRQISPPRRMASGEKKKKGFGKTKTLIPSTPPQIWSLGPFLRTAQHQKLTHGLGSTTALMRMMFRFSYTRLRARSRRGCANYTTMGVVVRRAGWMDGALNFFFLI